MQYSPLLILNDLTPELRLKLSTLWLLNYKFFALAIAASLINLHISRVQSTGCNTKVYYTYKVVESQFRISCVKHLKFVGDFASFFLKSFILCLGFFKMILKTIRPICPIENSITILALFLVAQRNDIANPFLCQHLLRLISRPHCKPFCLVVEHICNFAPLLTHIELPIFNFRMAFYCAK